MKAFKIAVLGGSDVANKRILQIPSHIPNNRIARKHTVIKYLYAMLIIAIISIPTITVLAANGVDVITIFRRKFGDKADLIQANIAVPEVNVLSNTFEDVDIDITGIAGDKKLIYVTMDITKKDGSVFNQREYEFDHITFNLQKLNDKLRENKLLDFDYLQSTSSKFMSIPDEDVEDNKMSFAYVVNIETKIEEQSYIIPGETYYLKLSNYDADNELGIGIWEGEFVANYVEADSITFEVNQTACFPRWGTDDDYNPSTEILISTIELSPFALRYICEYDKYLESNLDDRDHDFWHKIYFEMKDGSFIGVDSFETRISNLRSETHKGGFISGGGQNDGPYKWRWIYDEPLDVSKVKTINIGDLSINLENDK